MVPCLPPGYRPNIILGSNRFVGTNGLISYRGKEFFKIELSSDLKPLITVEVRDSGGKLLGKVWKSTSFVHSDKDYEANTDREGSEIKRLTLKNKETGQVVLEIIIYDNQNVEINGIFFLSGLKFPIIATKQYLDINTNKFIKNTFMKNGSGITLDNAFIAI